MAQVKKEKKMLNGFSGMIPRWRRQQCNVGFSAIFHHIMRKEFIEFSPSWPACTLKFEILCPLRKTKSFEKVFVHMLDSTILTNHTFNKLGQVVGTNE